MKSKVKEPVVTPVKVADKVAKVSAEKAEAKECYKQDCADIKELLTKMNQTLEKILTHINGGF